ncbi:MAG: hypothetical protein HC804_01765 [Anaerolineae bacterium]|nr:hypothetical protein [Anaerolineae bacterium]
MNELDLSLIRTDPGTQTRARLDMDTVTEYEGAIEANEGAWPFPPVIVFFDGAIYWLADGFHRVAAARRVLLQTAPADVREGMRRDAILYATGANANHGLKRSQADKRNAVRVLLNDEEWGQWSDREIARQCKVSHTFVSAIRREVTGNVASERTYTTKHGDTAVMNTANIGRGGMEDQDALRKTWIGVARSMIDICQEYAKTRDYVSEGEGQNHAEFHLLGHLRDEYGEQNDLTAMQKKLRNMTLAEIQEVLRHYTDHANDARANVSRWLNQQISKQPTAVPDNAEQQVEQEEEEQPQGLTQGLNTSLALSKLHTYAAALSRVMDGHADEDTTGWQKPVGGWVISVRRADKEDGYAIDGQGQRLLAAIAGIEHERKPAVLFTVRSMADTPGLNANIRAMWLALAGLIKERG